MNRALLIGFTFEVDIIVPVLQMRKLRHRKFKGFSLIAQDSCNLTNIPSSTGRETL
jgi:predicted amidophosphoribosyltransferase